MLHHRDPTCSYVPNTSPAHTQTIHATLALRKPRTSTPTLLIPFLSAPYVPRVCGGDSFDDFQSNAWVDGSSYPLTLAGLGISYGKDTAATSLDVKLRIGDQTFAPDESATPIQVDGEVDLISSLANAIDVKTPLPDLYSVPSARYMDYSSSVDSIHSLGVGTSFDYMEISLEDDMGPLAMNTIGLIPDVNMYDISLSMDPLDASVNPLDTISATSLHHSENPLEEYVSLTSEEAPTQALADNASTNHLKIEESPSSGIIQDIMSILIPPVPEFSLLPWSSPKLLTPPKGKRSKPTRTEFQLSSSPPLVKSEGPQFLHGDHYTFAVPYNLESQNPPACASDLAHSSPILNAHLGIELSELTFRAERFRTRNPGCDIDRAWLSHFAGKLSERGELLSDFRCYVIGCDQRNKRRDHILVHVGAHIGQRPFACSVWFVELDFILHNMC
ncbi:hypothetical protein PAXRUDRAFT_829926 [Paxillus rubicundulus Ve08.2h10]|uniref:C2H2-type domain-containing protein n=1 Tax=Paxillus rubicundulus Ve08.2h10 TaxID=930991 RepID=A0A0D0D6P2_9AGAM|nr:hypothetical protein PAXRUDRAFT_829926 [Paxillus rubicundulus Ve08.2h10]